jgi:hypothetical protein
MARRYKHGGVGVAKAPLPAPKIKALEEQAFRRGWSAGWTTGMTDSQTIVNSARTIRDARRTIQTRLQERG